MESTDWAHGPHPEKMEAMLGARTSLSNMYRIGLRKVGKGNSM